MAHSLSAKKRHRQNIVRRARNRGRRSSLRTRLRSLDDTLLHGTPEASEQAFVETCKMLDRYADRGLIHRNAAARKKSRLARRVNQKLAKQQGA